MSRLRSLLIVIAVWAALYLPWLGTSGLRSEEGHRVLPAVEMIASGDYLVPHVGGQPYLRKPPLINWLVAASFEITGQRNEWTARLPSVLAVLAVAIALVSIARRMLGANGSLAAALAWLTSLGMLEKGRMIEIEAVYVALFAFAFICWLTWWRSGRSPWLTWTVPWIFLGLGLLAKGPAHLLFFYALVFAILASSRRLRDLFYPSHSLGVAIAVGIFAAWAIPCARAVHGQPATWKNELLNRFTGSENTLNDWLLNWPLALAYFLPFGLLLPFVRFHKVRADEARIARRLFWGAAIPFVLVLLLPGAIQRYILPTLIPVYLLLGMAVRDDAFEWSPRLRKIVLALIGVIALGAAIVFPLRSATTQKERPGLAAAAAPVNAAIGPGEKLYAVDPGFQPYLFYVRVPIQYLNRIDELPADAHFVLVRPKLGPAFEHANAAARLLLRTTSFRGEETLLYRIGS